MDSVSSSQMVARIKKINFSMATATIFRTVKMTVIVVPAFLVGVFLLGVIVLSLPHVGNPVILDGWVSIPAHFFGR